VGQLQDERARLVVRVGLRELGQGRPQRGQGLDAAQEFVGGQPLRELHNLNVHTRLRKSRAAARGPRTPGGTPAAGSPRVRRPPPPPSAPPAARPGRPAGAAPGSPTSRPGPTPRPRRPPAPARPPTPAGGPNPAGRPASATSCAGSGTPAT